MRVGFCLHWREVSFYVSPQGEGRSPWFSVGAMTYWWDYDRVESPHLWLKVGPWVDWSWMWEKPTVAQTVEAVAARVLRRMVDEEAIRQMHLVGMLPRFEVSHEVIHGEVIRILERIEPERGGDDISIERMSSLYPEGNPIGVVPGQPFWFEGVTIRQGPPVVLEGLGQWTGCSSGCWHLVETPCRCPCHLRPATGREEALNFYGIRQEAEALRVERHRTLAEAHARAEPPTSVCSRCGRTFPVADLYTGQRTQRQACDSCLTAMVAAGTAKRPAEF